MVRALVKAGHDKYRAVRDGATPLYAAAWNGQAEFVGALVKGGGARKKPGRMVLRRWMIAGGLYRRLGTASVVLELDENLLEMIWAEVERMSVEKMSVEEDESQEEEEETAESDRGGTGGTGGESRNPPLLWSLLILSSPSPALPGSARLENGLGACSTGPTWFARMRVRLAGAP